MNKYNALSVLMLVVCGAALMFPLDVNAGEPIEPVPAAIEKDPAKVELGKKLFFEPRLSKSGFISCNSCHNLATGGVDNLPVSIGHKWQLGPINSPTVLNSRHNFVQFWDGRAADLKEQAGGPIENPSEMGSNHSLAVETLQSIPEYVRWFKDAYGSEKITIENVTDAIASFEETLDTPNSPFDQWLTGNENALSVKAREGYDLFKIKGCIACHNGVGVGGTSYQKFGAVKAYPSKSEKLGRFEVTKKEEDKSVFKVPLLRNVELTAPYLHDGSVWELKDVSKIMGEYQLGIEITKDDSEKILAFLHSLTGEQPKIVYPVLPPSTPSTPKPSMK